MQGFGKIFDPTLRLSLCTRTCVRTCVLEFGCDLTCVCVDLQGLWGWRWASPFCSRSSSGVNAHGEGVWMVVRVRQSYLCLHGCTCVRRSPQPPCMRSTLTGPSMLPQRPFLERSLVATGTLQGEASCAQWHVRGLWVNTVKGGSALDRLVQLEQRLWTGGVLVQVSWAGVRWAAVGPFRVDSPAALPELLEGCSGSSSWPWGRDGSGRSVLRAHGGS